MSRTIEIEHPAAVTATPSARLLFRLRERILTVWVDRVQEHVRTADALRAPIIINTIPLFLDGLAEALCEECSRETATESSNIAQEHGGERARVTNYGPDQIIEEYKILREVIRAQLQKEIVLTERDETLIQKSFDKAIQESMISYFLVHGKIREQFVATMTHDLRNPLATIQFSVELILRASRTQSEAQLRATIEDLSGRILKNVKRTDRMIQDMLDASVVQVGEPMAINITQGDMDEIVLAAIGEREENEKSRLAYKGNSVKGFWDCDSMQRSIENLIGNAFKYGDDSTPVTIEVRTSHERVMVSVHNLGNPIPGENIESLFQAFRRAESAKTSGKKGWGIGLALARSTAEHMGGSLGVESSAERGTIFTIDVPCDARPYQNAPTTG